MATSHIVQPAIEVDPTFVSLQKTPLPAQAIKSKC